MEEFNKPEGEEVPPAKRRRLQLESQESTSEEHFPVAKVEESNAIDSKNKNIFELPDEIWMKIMGYLSTYNLLRIVARASF